MSKKNKDYNKSYKKPQELPETTDHSWDGIREYNIPAPRWWLVVWMITIIWAIIYWFIYPSWPTIGGNNQGLKNWTSKAQLQEQQDKISRIKKVYLDNFSKASFVEIQQDSKLMEFALVGGKAAFKENCVACHNIGAQGGKGFPNLNDDDWLWGGKITDIYQTIKYGIRSSDDNTRFSQMPKFGLDQILNRQQIEAVTEYVMSFSDKNKINSKILKEKQILKEGQKIFQAECAVCHTRTGQGDRLLGAPNLTDAIWLYGKNKKDIIYTITHSRNGVMPAWDKRLDDDTIKQLTIYVHSLGGGE